MVALMTTYMKESDWLLKKFHQSEKGYKSYHGEKCVFVNAFPSHFHQFQFVKTRSHRFWWEWNLWKRVPIAKYWFVSLLIAWMKCNYLVPCVGMLKRLKSIKKRRNWPKNCILCDEAIAIVETTFPPLLAWFQFVKTRFRRFWHFSATGTCFNELKMQEILENCLRKHVLIAKNAQKRPK